jgi:phosphoglycolate phosphatase-like HAD superfamily hydrolase
LLPGAAEVLQECSAKSECYLVSLRRKPENLKQETRYLGLSGYFRKILTGHSESDGSDKKSELIKAELGDQDALIIGDTEADIKAGKILKVTTVAVLSGIRSEKFLKSVSPDYTIRSIHELPDLLTSLYGGRT